MTDRAEAPTLLSAGVIVARDVIEVNGRAYLVESGHTTERTRTLQLRAVVSGRRRTIRARRTAQIKVISAVRP